MVRKRAGSGAGCGEIVGQGRNRVISANDPAGVVCDGVVCVFRWRARVCVESEQSWYRANVL